jgi:uncharacterized iron-regulated membrane protein
VKLISILHRWTGGFLGIVLAVLGLTGTILVWEGNWIGLPGAHDPLRENVAIIGRIVERAAADGQLSRVTFASDEIGLHQLVFDDGGGAYVRQSGEVVDRWASQWERPELWLFDLHHHLFAGDAGETVTGIAGIAGLLLVLTGVVLWWRGRASFRPNLLPKRFAPGPIVKHHRDLGLLLSPVLALSLLTGVAMVFTPLRSALIGSEERPKQALAVREQVDAREALVRAKAMFPDAAMRRITLPSAPDKPVVVRMRQPFEWTPNGRTQVSFGPDGTVAVENARAANNSASLAEKLYPIHSAKIGGLVMKLLMTLSGLGLFVLGTFATYSFWARRSNKKRRRSTGGSLARVAS